ncbi:MAG: hypothetical protein M1826_003029 [Phylliscum demangeonii]|nr:MAG: hypothetical protein M1826_003029 [Phylliscum demangeonii]
MADQIFDVLRDTLDGIIDFRGQQVADTLTTWLLSISGVIAFVVGFVRQDIFLTLYLGLAGTALTFAVVVPPWPAYNRNPVRWLPVAGIAPAGVSVGVAGR